MLSMMIIRGVSAAFVCAAIGLAMGVIMAGLVLPS